MNFILLGYVSNNLNVCYFRHVKTRFKLQCKKISLKSNILFKLLEKKMSNVLPVTTNFALLKVQIFNSTISHSVQKFQETFKFWYLKWYL